jgi:rubredoxin
MRFLLQRVDQIDPGNHQNQHHDQPDHRSGSRSFAALIVGGLSQGDVSGAWADPPAVAPEPPIICGRNAGQRRRCRLVNPIRDARQSWRSKKRARNRRMKRYLCLGCGFLYDEALGLPEHGIAAGTRWADIPTGWVCPDCGTPKSLFEMVEIAY